MAPWEPPRPATAPPRPEPVQSRPQAVYPTPEMLDEAVRLIVSGEMAPWDVGAMWEQAGGDMRVLGDAWLAAGG